MRLDLVAKLKITKFFPGVFVGDSRKFMQGFMAVNKQTLSAGYTH